MKRTPLFRHARRSLPAAGVFLLAPVSLLPAANRFWVQPDDGSFFSTASWAITTGGASGASVPGAADMARFSLTGAYSVRFSAGSATNTSCYVDGNTTFLLNGNTYTLTNSNGAVLVGSEAGLTGRLTVTDGTLAVAAHSSNILIGPAADNTGFLTVTTGGIVGTAAARPSFSIGAPGTGTLTVNDTGRVTGMTLNIAGSGKDSTGTMTVTGPNALADFSNITTIGSAGDGTLSVLNGGTLTLGATLTLGNGAGSDGSAVVSGAGSSCTVDQGVTAGSFGDGSLTVSSGGALTTGAPALGLNSSGIGTAAVTGAGSQWNHTGAANIGSAGLGVLSITGGGRMESAGGSFVGANAGSEGRVTVSGAGSQWGSGNSTVIGLTGRGVLTISAGGEVAVPSAVLGNNAAAAGEATVTGSGSRFSIGTSLNVAPAGSGALSVLDGGTLQINGGLTVNDPAGAPVGTFTIDGGNAYLGGSFTCPGLFTFDDGLFQVAGNFQLGSSPGVLIINGFEPGDLPVLDLIGTTGTSPGLIGLVIGDDHRGKVMLRHGRNVSLAGNISVGADPGSEGTLSVESGAALNLPAGTLAVGGLPAAPGGAGTLDVAGGTVDVGTLRNHPGGTVNLSSGLLAVDAIASMDGRFLWTGGTLRFDANTSLTNAIASKLFGPVPALRAGQTLSSAGNASLILQTPLILDGGALNASILSNLSRLELRSGSLGGALLNNGLLLGDGVVPGSVTNDVAGRIRVDEGHTLTFTGAFGPNVGQLTLQGGTLEFSGAVTNVPGAFISGRGALYTGGLINNGQMAFSGGTMDIFGDVNVTPGSRVATSGAGSVTTFWDDVIHNGTEIFTGAGCSTVFFGAQTGAGSFTGSGTVYFIGDLRPGNSPATVTCASEAVFSPSTGVNLEIGGLNPGTQHDKLVFTSAATPQVEWNGSLTVSLVNGFIPAAGQSFDVFDFDSSRDAGAFATLALPALPNGLAWDISDLYTGGTLRVISSTGLTFDQWAATALGNPAATPSGDHDGDGFNNAVEFTLGLTPPQPGAVLPDVTLHNYPGGQRLRLLFTRPLDRTGVTLRIQAAGDLTNWTDLAVSVNSGPFTGPGFISEDRNHPPASPGLVEVRDLLTPSTAPRRHIRLLITIAP